MSILEQVTQGLDVQNLDRVIVLEVRHNAESISRNAAAMPVEWLPNGSRDERERILMELRHDLSDALKCVQLLQERFDAEVK